MFLFQSVHTFAHILDGAVCAQIQNNLTASNIVFVACGPSALASVNFISSVDSVFADYSQYSLHSWRMLCRKHMQTCAHQDAHVSMRTCTAIAKRNGVMVAPFAAWTFSESTVASLLLRELQS